LEKTVNPMPCPLCDAQQETYRIIAEDDHVYALLNRAPLTEGHTLVIPRRHVQANELTDEERISILRMIHRVGELLNALNPSMPAQAYYCDPTLMSIPDHVHYHVFGYHQSIRKILNGYDSQIPLQSVLPPEELTQIAQKIKSIKK